MPLQKNKNPLKSLLLAALLCGSVAFHFVARAADSVTGLSADAKKALSDKQDQLDAINAKIKAYQQIVDLKTRQGSTLNDQVQSLQAQADKLQSEIDLNKQKISDLESQIAILANRISEKETLINSQKRMLSELMQSYYENYTASSLMPGLLTASENLLNLKQGDWTADVSDRVKDLLDSMKTLRASLTDEQAVLVNKKIEADTLRVQLTDRNNYLQSAKDSKSQLLTKTQAEITKYNSVVDDLQKQRDEIENEIEGLEAGKLDSLNLKDMPAFSHGLLSYPLKTKTMSQGYGKTSFSTKSSYYGSSHFHNGLDYSAATGTPIYAAMNGKIVGMGNEGKYAYGKWVAIDHGNGLITLYGHMSSQLVKQGETVKEGEKIGLVGATGYATGPHVHFSVFSTKSFELVKSKVVSGLMIPIGATVNPSVYLP